MEIFNLKQHQIMYDCLNLNIHTRNRINLQNIFRLIKFRRDMSVLNSNLSYRVLLNIYQTGRVNEF